MAKEQIKTIIIGQHHRDPAAFIAAYNLIKRLHDNGVKVVCGHEELPIAKIKGKDVVVTIDYLYKDLQDNTLLKLAAAKLKSPDADPKELEFRPEGQILPKQNVRKIFEDKDDFLIRFLEDIEKFALVKYLKDSKIPLSFIDKNKDQAECDTIDRTAHVRASLQATNPTNWNKRYLQELNQGLAKIEPKRMAGMVSSILEMKAKLKDADNAVMVLFNIGNIHIERLAKHLKQNGLEEPIAIECQPGENLLKLKDVSDSMVDMEQRKKAFSQIVDSPEIRAMKADTHKVQLEYDQSLTKVEVNRSFSSVDSVYPGEFPDFVKISPYLDSIIPDLTVIANNAKITDRVSSLLKERNANVINNGETSSITLRRDKFDTAIRGELGFKKARLAKLSDAKIAQIQGISDSIVMVKDNNYTDNTYLCFYPEELGKKITAVMKEKEPAGKVSAGILESRATANLVKTP